MLLGLLLLSACASTPVEQRGETERPGISRSRSSVSPAELLRRAQNTDGEAAVVLRVQAAQRYYDEGNSDAATNILEDIEPTGLSNELRAEVLLFRAELALFDRDARSALNLLQPDSFPALNLIERSYQERFHRLRAEAYQSIEAMLSSALERIQLDRMLRPQQRERNHELIWDALGTLPMSQLQALAATAINYEVRGWYELALISRQYSSDLDRQLIELRRWRESWSRHPASDQLPPEMELVETMARERPTRIALLLPLGSAAGQIVRDSFMSAYFNLLELGGQVPEVRLYNTSTSPEIAALHRRAVDEGAELVIGPLLKEHVAQLQDISDLRVPTLALNNVEGRAPASRLLYQFSLSPEDEARQLADKAWRDGHRRVAILHPAGELRRRDSFVEEWQRLGGEVVAEESYFEDYTETIRRLLELDHSNERHEELNSLLRRQTVFQPRRRQDIDSILLIAQPGPGRQIVPSLAYLFAGDIPVYASQDIYSGQARPVEDRDLNGVTFGESPWVLGQNDTSVSRTRELFPQNSAQTLRLQAFGIDAFRLYPRLRLLSANPGSSVPGATGMLRLGDNRNIQRQLTWTSINDGLATIQEQ